jgi:hypothetical protein
MSEAKTTIDHNTIRKWVEQRGGHPARVKGTADKSGGGLLRIDYSGYSGEGTLQDISWEEFFEEFDNSNLAFLHQDKTEDGKESRFSKLVTRERGRGA